MSEPTQHVEPATRPATSDEERSSSETQTASTQCKPARLSPEKPPAVKAVEDECEEASPWDEVDEASWESFPASDPPSYSGTHAGTKRKA